MISRLRREWARSDRLLYLLTALVTGGVTVAALELWDARFDVPFTYWGDALAVAAHFKTVLETGWYEYQPLLGAPYGQTYNDFPTADNLNFMAARVLGLLTNNYVVALNLYYVLGFVAAALTALWLFRRLGISRAVSVALSVTFAIAPYHFIRGESHLWLASYYIVPLSIGLVIMVLRGEALWSGPPPGSKWYRWLTSRAAGTVLILALTGTSQSYYSFFFLVLIAFAGVVRLVRSGDWRRFWGAAAAGVTAAFVMLLNMLPDMVYSWVNGVNAAALARGHIDSEVYGLKLTQLLLPWVGHRIPRLQHIRALYDATYPLPSEGPALGAIAAAGLVALFLVLAYVATTIASPRLRSAHFTERFGLLSGVAALTFVCFLLSTMGGLSTIVSFFTTSLRGWNRMSIFIALLCLIAVGILLDGALKWLATKTVRMPRLSLAVPAVVSLLVMGVAFVDQTPGNSGASYGPIAKAWDADAAWFQQIDEQLPAGALVLQLPYQPFPESVGPTGVLSTDALLPYLHTTDIRWSAAGIKGRPRSDWSNQFALDPAKDTAVLAAAAGFSGIHIDSKAMGEDTAADLVRGLRAYLRTAPLVSADGRYTYFDLRPEMSRLEREYTPEELAAIADRVTAPLTIAPDATFVNETLDDGSVVVRSTADAPAFSLANPGSDPVDARLTLRLHLQEGTGARSVLVTLPGGSTVTVPVVDGVVSVDEPVTLAPGESRVSLALSGASGSGVRALVLDSYRVEDAVLASFVSEAAAAP